MYPRRQNVTDCAVSRDEVELIELYRMCDDEWRGFVMTSALAAAEQHNVHAPPGLVLVEGRAGRRYPPPSKSLG